MTNTFRTLIAVVLLGIIAVLPACYTVLKHPRLASLDYQRPKDSACLNCHSNAEIWNFNHPNNIQTYVGKPGSWSEYYDYAWWYEHRWDYEPDNKNKKEKNENKTVGHQ
jgi:hypothetical protein